MTSLPPLAVDGTTDQLRTVGLRIRNSVPKGYQLPKQVKQEEKKSETPVSIKRVPLPSRLQNQPPSLTFANSSSGSSLTMSSSTLSCWEEEINKPERRHMQTLDEIPSIVDNKGIKHNLDEFIIIDDGAETPKDLRQYVQQYGPLSFNDEF
ncbi:DEKNAAC101070 [Brettanomyces naardenensis]|uniref:Damage-regulated import facilitator 1 n=1 Tax=Brettanomyces naardenensis TaxID=13370 RepID=A0A448YGW5_BRENA|nr:DEKNAAC101070 [Brettanomyces naardenensis]